MKRRHLVSEESGVGAKQRQHLDPPGHLFRRNREAVRCDRRLPQGGRDRAAQRRGPTNPATPCSTTTNLRKPSSMPAKPSGWRPDDAVREGCWTRRWPAKARGCGDAANREEQDRHGPADAKNKSRTCARSGVDCGDFRTGRPWMREQQESSMPIRRLSVISMIVGPR